MFAMLGKKLAYWLVKKQIEADGTQGEQSGVQENRGSLTDELEENIRLVKGPLGESNDVIVRRFFFGADRELTAAIIYLDGLVNTKTINDSVIRPLMYGVRPGEMRGQRELHSAAEIREKVLSVGEVCERTEVSDILMEICSGDAALLVDGMKQALMFNAKGWERRSVEQPPGENVVRGPREGFTENIRTNTALLRRKIKAPELTLETLILGRRTKTIVSLAYIKGVAKESLLKDIRQRLNAINTDSILESGYVEQFIEDAPFSIFQTVGYTEKPDVAAAKLLEGRAAILVDGTPFVLTVPFLFIENFQAAEDYYSRPYVMSLLRIIRYFSYFVTVYAPSIYVALTTFHQELIPTDLLFTMVAAREGIPFPAMIEALVMLVTFEILREAGVRLPRPVGQALSIVGALVVGDAAVSAGLIGAPMVIVVAITAVSIFVVPNLTEAAAVQRVIYILLSGFSGGFGIILGTLGVVVHLSSLKSFGYHYFSPFAPFETLDQKDALVRAPLWVMINRPKGMAQSGEQKRRQFIVPPVRKKGSGGDEAE